MYRFNKKEKGIYTLNVIVTESFDETIEFKINDGAWGGKIDWGFDSDFNIVEYGQNGIIRGLSFGQSISFELNTITRKLSFTISGWTIDQPEPNTYDYYFAFAGNGWSDSKGLSDYKFTKDSDNTFTFTYISIKDYNTVEEPCLKFKVMCSNDVLYGTDDLQTSLNASVFAQTFKVYNLLKGQKVVVTLDTAHMTVSWNVL